MSIAPLHGRPAPLLFTKHEDIRWPRASANELKNAPLTTRARRMRRRRVLRLAMIAALLLGTVAALIWVALAVRS